MANEQDAPVFAGHKSPDLSLVIPLISGFLPADQAEKIKSAWNFYMSAKPVFDWLFSLFKHKVSNPPSVVVIPPTLPPPPVIVAPPVPVAPAGALDDIAAFKTAIRWFEEPERWHNGQRGNLYDRDAFLGIIGGNNLARDSRIAFDFTPIADSGSDYQPDDPRWAQVQHSLYARHAGEPDADCPTWFEYEFNGHATDAFQGDGGWGQGAQAGEVEPESVVSDGVSPATGKERRNGCTPVALVTGPGTIRARLHYIRHDGKVVSAPWSALIHVSKG